MSRRDREGCNYAAYLPDQVAGWNPAISADLVADLNRTFAEVNVVVVTRNLGMTVAQSTVLRNKMRDAGAS